jgi:putative ABC transport system substrate-binding protein
MNKIIRIILIAAAIVGAGSVYISNKSAKKSEALRIAIFTPTTHQALEEIEQGFKETLQKPAIKSCVFTTFNANGNRTLLRAQAEEIVGGNYDMIFTIGAFCSQTIAELLHKKELKTPHVFGGVDGPEFAESLVQLNQSSTGVYVKSDYKHEMEMLHKLKPSTKNILLVYDPTHGTGLEKYKREIEDYVKQLGITLHAVEVYHTNEIQQKVAASLPQMDVVLVLTDNTVVAGIDTLVNLCNRYGVTLLASDLSSGEKGAALAYGITEYESGSGAGEKAVAIIVNGKKPAELPVTAITNFRMKINRSTMKAQGLELDDDMLKQYENLGGSNV